MCTDRIARSIFVLGFIALLGTIAPQAFAQGGSTLRGAALVIGNSDYAHLPKLKNPENDADAIEEMLADLGFDSVRRSDRSASKLLRDLERFAEDAAEADVAVLYYAGHGIEAGGENFLVPVDADLSALDAAAERLVPISAILKRLQQEVPILIVMLDACRDNPFPDDAQLRLSATEAASPITSGGLAAVRGATAIRDSNSGAGNFGTVISFAAEPGKPALDGDGENSPYTAAVLKHLTAMAGSEFGTVMRMVAEEVYLNTEGRQRPWVNENLRRLLYFGEAPERPEGAEGSILNERRQLLLRIADLSTVQRRQAENLANSGNVPMSVVYAMMQAMGVDPDADPKVVEARLRQEIERFAENQRSQDALNNPDPEIRRLTQLANEAELEGAFDAANQLREQAKNRVGELRQTREEQIGALRQRISEDAAVFARSAETKKLLFRHNEAALDYAGARAIVAEWDKTQARELLLLEIDALTTDAELKGTQTSLARAESLARKALSQENQDSNAEQARIAHALSRIILVRAGRNDDVAAMREALSVLNRASADIDSLKPGEQARIFLDKGRVSGQIALLTSNFSGLTDAEDFFAKAVSLAQQAADTSAEAEARFHRMQALYFRWSAKPSVLLFASVQTELAALSAMLSGGGEIDYKSARFFVRTPQIALDFATRQNTPESLTIASEANAIAANMFDRDHFPIAWAETAVTDGRIGLEWESRFGDPTHLDNALESLNAALDIYQQAGARSGIFYAKLNRALTLTALGLRHADERHLRQALAEWETIEDDPLAEANTLRQLRFHKARVKAGIGHHTGNAELLFEAIELLKTVRLEFDPSSEAYPHTLTGAELGKAVLALASTDDDPRGLREATELLGTAISRFQEWQVSQYNPVPFNELYARYADATARLAIKTGKADDIDLAIETGVENNRKMLERGNEREIAMTANVLAVVIAQSLRRGFDMERAELGRAMTKLALDHTAATSTNHGDIQNTACQIETEIARFDSSLSGATAALTRCSNALTRLEADNRKDVIPIARESVTRAKLLVESLTGR